MNADLIRRVWERAGDRCEYCQLPPAFHPAPFQIDHIIARQHGGKTELENLALACIHCNRFKGPNLAELDPDTGEIVRLFHPRCDSWAEHFVWDGPELKARTQIGRLTLVVLIINAPEVVVVRRALQDEGVFLREQAGTECQLPALSMTDGPIRLRAICAQPHSPNLSMTCRG